MKSTIPILFAGLSAILVAVAGATEHVLTVRFDATPFNFGGLEFTPVADAEPPSRVSVQRNEVRIGEGKRESPGKKGKARDHASITPF
jgi:hypothetical protein